MHLKRLLIALIVLPLVYFYVTKLPLIYYVVLLAVSCAVAIYEFYLMYNVNGLLRYLGIGFGIAVIFAHYLSKDLLADLFIAFFMIAACVRLLAKREPASSFREIAAAAGAVIYIPGLLGYQVYLRGQGAEWIIFLYGCVWASDSMAYYIGSSIGKRKLYEEISPNKTVAGAFGSIVGGAIGAVIVKSAFIYSVNLPLIKAVILGIMIGFVSIIGDLVESMFKRDAGVKDSSRIVPGHGGVLDKIDSALFAGPLLYWSAVYLRLIR